MKRRRFLQALSLGAGAPMLMPLFSQILRAEEPGYIPRRFVIFMEGNGLEANAVLSSKVKQAIVDAGGSNRRYAYQGYAHTSPLEVTQANLASATGLSALNHADGNLESEAALVMGLSNTISGGGHATQSGALSCARHRKVGPSGPTIESTLSQSEHILGNTPFSAVRLGVENGKASVGYDSCAFDKGKPAPLMINPTAAFNVLFGSVSTGAGRAVFEEKTDLLDFTRKDINRALKSFSGSSPERQKLEDYLESVEDLVARQDRLAMMDEQLAAAKPSEPADNPFYGSEDPFERLAAHTDLAIAALKGGLTQVVVVTLGTEGTHGFAMSYPQLKSMYPGGNIMAGHDLRHGAEHGNEDCINVLHAVTKQFFGEMTRVARALQSTAEVGTSGTMLDHTAMIYMSSNGEKHHSEAREWPMVLLGGKALGFKTEGRAIVYPGQGRDTNRQVSNMFNSLGHAAGIDLNTFGDEGTKRIQEGPLSEIWSA